MQECACIGIAICYSMVYVGAILLEYNYIIAQGIVKGGKRYKSCAGFHFRDGSTDADVECREIEHNLYATITRRKDQRSGWISEIAER